MRTRVSAAAPAPAGRAVRPRPAPAPVLLGALLLAAFPARADEGDPTRFGLPHQGRLLDRADTPVDGVRGLTFALYRSPDAQTPVWVEVRNVEFANGFYAVLLGDPALSGASPLDASLFEGPLYLGITVFPDAELRPRLPLGIVPFAGRARLADRVEGGTITNATITGGTIADSRLAGVEIAGGRLAGVTLEASRIDASDLYIGGEKVSAHGVRRDGDTMTGPLSATRFVASATDGAPLEVRSRARVDNLNAELLDGHASTDFVLKSELDPARLLTSEALETHDFTNLVNGGAFEHWLHGGNAAPNWWRAEGSWAIGYGFVQRTEGVDGHGLTLIDNDPAGRVGVAQRVFASPSPRLVETDYTVSVKLRRVAGAGEAEICLADSALSRTCQLVDPGAGWTIARLTHRTSGAPQFLEVTLAATADAAQDAEVRFDEVVLVRGRAAVPFRRSPADHLPSGLVAYFPGACPPGFVEYEPARGRAIVGTPGGGSAEAPVGAALGDRGLRTITAVPAHAHEVDPPSTVASAVGDHTHVVDAPSQNTATVAGHTHQIDPPDTASASGGAHAHSVDPPAFTSDTGGDHRHGVPTFTPGATAGFAAWANGNSATAFTVKANTDFAGSHTHTIDLGRFSTDNDGAHAHVVNIAPFASGLEGGHAHVVNLAPFPSAGGGAHNHAVDVPRFSSASTGESAVDVTMPYVQLTACRAL